MSKNNKTLIILLIACLFMFGFGFALVPLYNLVCEKFGINGKTNFVAANKAFAVDHSRAITIYFLANVNSKLPWKLYPVTKQITVHPGETKKTFYIAENTADHTITAQAVPSVTPGFAAQYFKKIECFCFRQQTLRAHQTIKMPVIFYIDRDLPKKVHEITLSYTMYPAR